MKICVILTLLALCFGAVAQETELTTASVTGQRNSPAASRKSSEATIIVQSFFGGLTTPSPLIPPLVEEVTNEFKKEESGWQVTPHPANRSMSVAPPIRSEEVTVAAATKRDVSETPVTELEVSDTQEPRVVKAAPQAEMAHASLTGSETAHPTKKPVATAQKSAHGFAIFKGDADSEKPKRAKEPLFKNLFAKKSRPKEISVEK